MRGILFDEKPARVQSWRPNRSAVRDVIQRKSPLSKLEAAQEATEAVQEYVRQAFEVLQGENGKVNAGGVLQRPHDYRDAPLAARRTVGCGGGSD